MTKWQMYNRIQQLKQQGFSIRKVSRMIRVSRTTVSKYWDITSEEYSKILKYVNNKSPKLSKYETVILHWLEAYPCMTASQVRDWLLEKHNVAASDRTVRDYVINLREKYLIKKESEPIREYEAVDEMPKGFQLQVDFGVKWVKDAYNARNIKLHVAAFSLSYSRYKWGVFQTRSFTSLDLVKAFYDCFKYFGGQPHEICYDQDSIIVASENNGDIIHTQAFSAFLAETKINTLCCHKQDPETKGKIEAVVKYIKGNFMANRQFMGINLWNQSFLEWLERTGNGRIHTTTKRTPAAMFEEEKPYLLPLVGVAPIKHNNENERFVYKDNVIFYKSNRYTVPLGTFGKHERVVAEADGSFLNIYSLSGDKLCTHPLCQERGKLIKSDEHRRDTTRKIQERLDRTVLLLGEEFRDYLTMLCILKPRYTKEQLDHVVKTCENYGRANTLAALDFCV